MPEKAANTSKVKVSQPITILFLPSQLEALKRLSKLHCCSVGSLVRRAVLLFIDLANKK